VLAQLRNVVVVAESFNALEGNRKHLLMAKMWKAAGVIRLWHAGIDTSRNPGSPKGSWYEVK